MGRTRSKQEIIKKTTVWDFLIAFGSGFVNLLKIEKIVCIVVVYILCRDIYFLTQAGNIDYQNRIIDTELITKILMNENTREFILFTIIVCLVIIILILVGVIRFVYVKEINRLAEERSRLMHDVALGKFEPLKKHNTSKKI